MRRKPLYLGHIAGPDGDGSSEAVPAELLLTEAQLQLNHKRKQEIGTWRTSRHKISRILF